MAKANAEATAERVDHLQGMILAGETNTACVAYARQTWGVSRSQGARLGNGRCDRWLNASGSWVLFRSEMPLRILCMAGRANGTGLAQETQAPPGKPVSTLPF